jgi:C4-dicarboxylate-specific signal transduction histidine kinase
METSLKLQSGERSFEVQIQLFRGVKDAVQGAVVSFDNTEIVNSPAEARLIKQRLSDIPREYSCDGDDEGHRRRPHLRQRRFRQVVNRDSESVVRHTDGNCLARRRGRGCARAITRSSGRKSPSRSKRASSSTVTIENDSKSHLILMLFDAIQRVCDHKTIELQQEELTRFGRFAALGEAAAAGIAHEVNAPLNVITTKSNLLRRLADYEKLGSEKVVKATTDIDQMVKNISGIVGGLKSLVKKDATKVEGTNLSICPN